MNSSCGLPAGETLPPPQVPLRLVLFGLPCRFTDGVVAELERHGMTPTAILLPGPPGLRSPYRVIVPGRQLPMATRQPAGRARSDTERYRVGSPRSSATLDLVNALGPDIIAVACYPRRLPRELYSIAGLRAVNVHPSLLPLHRGPDPLFWTFRDGAGEAGVTIHDLVEELDAGPVLAQERVLYQDGTTESDLEGVLAATGGRLLASTVRRIRDGTIQARDQPVIGRSHEGWPSDDDYVIDTQRSARSAYNFIRGTSERGIPIGIKVGDTTTWVRTAIGWSGTEPTTNERSVAVRFEDGFLLIEPDTA